MRLRWKKWAGAPSQHLGRSGRSRCNDASRKLGQSPMEVEVETWWSLVMKHDCYIGVWYIPGPANTSAMIGALMSSMRCLTDHLKGTVKETVSPSFSHSWRISSLVWFSEVHWDQK